MCNLPVLQMNKLITNKWQNYIHVPFPNDLQILVHLIITKGRRLEEIVYIDLLWKALFYPKCFCLQCQNCPFFQAPSLSLTLIYLAVLGLVAAVASSARHL